jgi:hypothetical protein
MAPGCPGLACLAVVYAHGTTTAVRQVAAFGLSCGQLIAGLGSAP